MQSSIDDFAPSKRSSPICNRASSVSKCPRSDVHTSHAVPAPGPSWGSATLLPPMNNLIEEAVAARENAVAPFSKFKVGAALRTAGGKVFRGCNVENCTYGLTVCAERVALLSALAAGQRSFTAIAVVTQSPEPGTPCGPCRQVMPEDCCYLDVSLANLTGQTIEYKLSTLFPHPFAFSLEG